MSTPKEYISKKVPLVCEICNKSFFGQKIQKTCGRDCRNERYAKMYQRGVLFNKNIPTASVGAASEMTVCSDLLTRGFSVFRAISAACFCDLIAIKGKEYYEIEVRTGYKSITGNLAFPYKKGERNHLYAVCDRNTKEIFYLNNKKLPFSFPEHRL